MANLNPIVVKLKNLIDNGLSMEKICAVSDVRYNTLKQVFVRNRVSKMIMLSLLRSNIITDEDKLEYDKWFRENEFAKSKKRGRKPKDENIRAQAV